MTLRMDKVLKQLIKEKRISVRELSRATRIPQSTLNALVQGREPSKPQHLLAIAKYFSCSVEFLLTGEDKRAPTLEEVLTQELFSGWIKIRVEKAIPNKRKFEPGEDT